MLSVEPHIPARILATASNGTMYSIRTACTEFNKQMEDSGTIYRSLVIFTTYFGLHGWTVFKDALT